MRKLSLSFYYITFLVFLQVVMAFSGVSLGVFGVLGLSGDVYAEEADVETLTETQKNTIVDHCDVIRDNLKSLQRADSRARVYLGRHYETILTGFITPLNVRLVENNLSNTQMIDNQTKFAARRDRFVNDYISYQQELENLVNTNCRTEPEKFYRNLVSAREKRATVNRDVLRLQQMADEQVKLTEGLVKTLKEGEK